jgi:hypothetical protein
MVNRMIIFRPSTHPPHAPCKPAAPRDQDSHDSKTEDRNQDAIDRDGPGGHGVRCRQQSKGLTVGARFSVSQARAQGGCAGPMHCARCAP